MIAVPLVFFAVIDAVGRLHGQKSIATLSGKTFLWFALTAVLAVGVGLGVALLLDPGEGVENLVASEAIPAPGLDRSRYCSMWCRQSLRCAGRWAHPAGAVLRCVDRCGAGEAGPQGRTAARRWQVRPVA